MHHEDSLPNQELQLVTLNVAGWIDVFTAHEYCDIVINSLNHCIEHKNLQVYEYVLLPSRLHMIVKSNKGHVAKVLREFKGHAGKQVLKSISQNPNEKRKEWLMRLFQFFTSRYVNDIENHFWQFGNHPEKLPDSEAVEQKATYLRQIPVAEKMVSSPTHYVYSSANPRQRVKLATWE